MMLEGKSAVVTGGGRGITGQAVNVCGGMVMH
jgi:NAD(P)-dependent dehydrogenase (short-subunit alcohol dehydrogenase family)